MGSTGANLRGPNESEVAAEAPDLAALAAVLFRRDAASARLGVDGAAAAAAEAEAIFRSKVAANDLITVAPVVAAQTCILRAATTVSGHLGQIIA